VVIQISNNLLYTDFVRDPSNRTKIDELFEYAENKLRTIMDIENIVNYSKPTKEEGKSKYIMKKKFPRKRKSIKSYLKSLYKSQSSKMKKQKEAEIELKTPKLSLYEEISIRLGFKP
jgi:hypothetical protein